MATIDQLNAFFGEIDKGQKRLGDAIESAQAESDKLSRKKLLSFQLGVNIDEAGNVSKALPGQVTAASVNLQNQLQSTAALDPNVINVGGNLQVDPTGLASRQFELFEQQQGFAQNLATDKQDLITEDTRFRQNLQNEELTLSKSRLEINNIIKELQAERLGVGNEFLSDQLQTELDTARGQLELIDEQLKLNRGLRDSNIKSAEANANIVSAKSERVDTEAAFLKQTQESPTFVDDLLGKNGESARGKALFLWSQANPDKPLSEVVTFAREALGVRQALDEIAVEAADVALGKLKDETSERQAGKKSRLDILKSQADVAKGAAGAQAKDIEQRQQAADLKIKELETKISALPEDIRLKQSSLAQNLVSGKLDIKKKRNELKAFGTLLRQKIAKGEIDITQGLASISLQQLQLDKGEFSLEQAKDLAPLQRALLKEKVRIANAEFAKIVSETRQGKSIDTARTNKLMTEFFSNHIIVDDDGKITGVANKEAFTSSGLQLLSGLNDKLLPNFEAWLTRIESTQGFFGDTFDELREALEERKGGN